MRSFADNLSAHNLQLRRGNLETLQINLGRKCNQACRHCHVDAAPWRTEMIDAPTAERICAWMLEHQPPIVDLTGGAPELSEFFPAFVQTARSYAARVIDRNNLTILSEPGFEWLPAFLSDHQVEVIASLPCYLEANVSRQRGNGVFQKSIQGLKMLNRAGYGSRLPLHLVYNPVGPTLPPPQSHLEQDYREVLGREYGICFNRLLTITNQPIARFAEDLRASGRYSDYINLLVENFNPETIPGLMCRSTLSVGLRGEIYDCDFNQMLGMQVRNGKPLFLWDVTPPQLLQAGVMLGEHCYACTAGCGSSCTGAVA